MHRPNAQAQFNCQSAIYTCENAIVFYYSQANFIVILMLTMSACGLIFVMLKLPYPNYLKSLTSQFSTFLRDLLARRNLCTATSRASSLEAKWYGFIMMKHRMQFSVLSVLCGTPMCLQLYTINTLHDLIQLPCMHACMNTATQLHAALAYVLMHYYGNIASSIGEINLEA